MLPLFNDMAGIILIGLKPNGGAELLYIYEKLFLFSQLLLLGDYSRNKLLPNSDLCIRVFMHSLHCCSWAKEVWEHKLRLFCFIVQGTHGIVFCNTNEDTVWGLGPFRKILNFFPFHFFFTGSSLPGVKSVATRTNLLPWKPQDSILSSPRVVTVKWEMLGGFLFVFGTTVPRNCM